MTQRRWWLQVVLLVLVLMVAGTAQAYQYPGFCEPLAAASAAAGLSPAEAPTSWAADATGVLAEAPTRVNATGSRPTPVRLSFSPGSTSLTVAGHLPPYGQGLYALRASANQVMEVQLDSADQVLLEIWGADGQPLKRGAVGGPFWRGVLPATQDYYIGVTTPDGTAANYTLRVSIPVRIRFSPGGSSATVSGRVAAYGSMYYILKASGGQTLSLVLDTAARDIRLEVYGFDGTVLKRAATGAKAWTGTLPSTQDYLIRLVSFGGAANYVLRVTIPPLDQAKPMRIAFASGSTTASVAGHLALHGQGLYTLRASANQVMEVQLDSADQVLLEIWGADGQPLKRGAVGGPFWRGVLPATQDYYIGVTTPDGRPADYVLRVSIPVRIRFSPGGTSATVSGRVAAYGSMYYILKASAGQTLSLVLDTAARDIRLEVYGLDGTVLKRAATGAKTWTGTLPSTQDYLVNVVSFGNAADFRLKVTIP